MGGLQELTNALSNGTIPDPLRPPLPQDWGFATPTQNCNRYYLRNGLQIWPEHSQGPSEEKPIKNWEKREHRAWAHPGTAQIVEEPHIITGTGKAANFKFCTHIHSINRKKNKLKISGKVAVGIVSDCRKFSGHSYRAHRAVIFAIAQLSCYVLRLSISCIR